MKSRRDGPWPHNYAFIITLPTHGPPHQVPSSPLPACHASSTHNPYQTSKPQKSERLPPPTVEETMSAHPSLQRGRGPPTSSPPNPAPRERRAARGFQHTR